MNYLLPLLILVQSVPAPVPAEAQENVLLADPFIMLHDGTYYAYGTHSERGIEVYTSDDLEKWDRHNRLALDRQDSWGERYFWAPEVYNMGGKFHMYYCADEHICAAVSDSPLGPFMQTAARPMLEGEKTLDPSLFVDEDGRAYLFFVRTNGGSAIWMAEMTENRLDIRPETMQRCLTVTEAWEKVWPEVMNGPYVFRRDDTYYMLFYANSHESRNCGVGYATAPGVWGPWTKSASNPILQKPGPLVGTGQCSLFTDKEGELRIAFHSHYDTMHVDPRKMHIGQIRFRKMPWSSLSLLIDGFYITPIRK